MAEIPAFPFHFEFRFRTYNAMEMEEQKLSNEKTNEAFWITQSKGDYNHDYTCIKRFTVKKAEAGASSQKT